MRFMEQRDIFFCVFHLFMKLFKLLPCCNFYFTITASPSNLYFYSANYILTFRRYGGVSPTQLRFCSFFV